MTCRLDLCKGEGYTGFITQDKRRASQWDAVVCLGQMCVLILHFSHTTLPESFHLGATRFSVCSLPNHGDPQMFWANQKSHLCVSCLANCSHMFQKCRLLLKLAHSHTYTSFSKVWPQQRPRSDPVAQLIKSYSAGIPHCFSSVTLTSVSVAYFFPGPALFSIYPSFLSGCPLSSSCSILVSVTSPFSPFSPVSVIYVPPISLGFPGIKAHTQTHTIKTSKHAVAQFEIEVVSPQKMCLLPFFVCWFIKVSCFFFLLLDRCSLLLLSFSVSS